MKMFMAVLLAAWFVVNNRGQSVAGPFVSADDCRVIAAEMARQNPNILSTCRWK